MPTMNAKYQMILFYYVSSSYKSRSKNKHTNS